MTLHSFHSVTTQPEYLSSSGNIIRSSWWGWKTSDMGTWWAWPLPSKDAGFMLPLVTTFGLKKKQKGRQQQLGKGVIMPSQIWKRRQTYLWKIREFKSLHAYALRTKKRRKKRRDGTLRRRNLYHWKILTLNWTFGDVRWDRGKATFFCRYWPITNKQSLLP